MNNLGHVSFSEQPNWENISLADLEVAAKVSPSQRGFVRMSFTGMVCPRTGKFYALMFNYTVY